MNPILTIDNLSHSYHTKSGETMAIQNLSLKFLPGSFTAIVGPSGCGKTTLLSLLSGQIPPESGRIIIDTTKDARVGYMLQKDNLFQWRTILQNTLLGLEINHIKTKANVDYVLNLLKKYGLYEFRNSRPSELSGGMKQRAALIRTLALRPDILLLDEPFSALDYQTRTNVRQDICSILLREKKTVILVTHDIDEAIEVADDVVILTKRPATVLKTVHIGERDLLSKDRYHNEIKEALHNETG